MQAPLANDIEPLEQPSGLLPVDPPARGARWAGWLLLTLSVAAGVFAFTIRLPENVIASFTLVPVDGEDPVQAPIAGELAAVSVKEGQVVARGDELFRLRSDELRNAQSRIRQLTEDRRALTERMRRLDDSHVAELAIKDAEVVQAERELGFREKHLETIRDLVRRSEGLAAAGSVSPVELLAHRLNEAESEKNRAVTEKTIQQLTLHRKEMVMIRERQRADEKAEATKLDEQIANLRAQVADATGDLRSVRAPYDAIVLRVNQHTPGGIVAAGAELCHLARGDARPRARLVLPERGVPRLSKGQTVRLFFGAFPYQRHGTVAAHIAWISPSPVTIEGGRGFIALADFPSEAPAVLPIRIGMGGEARVLVGRRTLVERTLEPLRAVREKLRTE